MNRPSEIKSEASFSSAATAVLVATAFGFSSLIAADTLNSPTNVWTAPARAARKQNPVPADDISIAKGKELFVQACLPCHGPAGKGDGPAAVSLERGGLKIRPGNLSDPKMWQQTDGVIFWKISEGNSPMPSFGEAFTEDQRWQIVNYVRTLAPRTTATAKAK